MGGNWNDSTNAGLWYVNCNYDASNANTNIGARLASDNGRKPTVYGRPDGAYPSERLSWLLIGAEDEQPAAASSLPNVAAGFFLRPSMHTSPSLFSQIVDFDNLWAAYLAARQGKRYRPEIACFAAHLDENLINIQNHLVWGSWHPGPASQFVIREPKRREIQAPPFADRVVHHALVRVVEPLFERRFVKHSYACRRGKGVQRAIMALQRMERRATRNWATPYVVKADIKSFFASIRHDVLFGLVERVVSCPQTLALWRAVVSGYGHENGVGLPVGALTSQLGANIMLDHLDHVLTDQCGHGRYLRYMDDFILLAPSKAAAWEMLGQAIQTLSGLGLALNPKTAVFPLRCGVDFCGYRVWPTHILPRKRNIRRARRAFRTMAARYSRGEIGLGYVWPRIASFLAYTKHCNAARTVERILADTILQRGDSNANY